jgi:post-segregation antitoxin (ccd killing protein)
MLGQRRSVLRRILRRMPRLQVYLPNDLYRAVKERGLPASELLQGAVRAELRRQELLDETSRYLTELVDEVGEPSAPAVARAESLSRRIRKAETQSPRAS